MCSRDSASHCLEQHSHRSPGRSILMAGLTEFDNEKTAAEMELRDGNYLLSVFVSPGETLSIEVERKSDGSRWRGDFTARYIEDVTQRAGNVKSFSNFVKMLRSATTASSRSKSLHVDVLTYQDLEMLKDQKNSATDKENSNFGNVAIASDKRYLILTYITEFDRVHYPLPLLPEEVREVAEPPDMRKYVLHLRSELESMKTRLKKYECSNTSRQQRSRSVTSHGEDEKSTSSDRTRCSNRIGRPSDATRMHTPSTETRALQEKVRVLEDRLGAEAMAHKKSITAFVSKNTILQDEARKARMAERRMSDKLRDSEFQISLLRGRLKSLGGCSSAVSNNISPFRRRGQQRTSSASPPISRYINQRRLRPFTPPPHRSYLKDEGRLRRPSSSPSTSPYVQHGPASLPSRSRGSSPMYSHSTIPPPQPSRTSGRSSSCPTSMSRGRKDSEIDAWLRASKPTKKCPTPPRTTARTKTPPSSCQGRSLEPITQRPIDRSKIENNYACSEVGEIDSRLSALQHYLKRMNA